MPSTQAPCIQGLLAQSSKLISQLRPIKRPREMILCYHRNVSTSAYGATQSEVWRESRPSEQNKAMLHQVQSTEFRTEKPRGLDYSYLAMICPFYSVVMEMAQGNIGKIISIPARIQAAGPTRWTHIYTPIAKQTCAYFMALGKTLKSVAV